MKETHLKVIERFWLSDKMMVNFPANRKWLLITLLINKVFVIVVSLSDTLKIIFNDF